MRGSDDISKEDEGNKVIQHHIPHDYEYLDPARPPISYEGDLTPEEKVRFADALAELAAKAEANKATAAAYEKKYGHKIGEAHVEKPE